MSCICSTTGSFVQIAVVRKEEIKMYQPKKINIGDRVTLKKNHPCGGNTFVITRTGMDFRMKCETCKKEVWIERPELERRIKKIEVQEEE